MTNRVFNFNPGPAALPLVVLEQIRDELLDFKGTGMSILESSHRSKPFEGVLNDAVARTKRLMNLGDDFHVVFVQGGASLQFAMVPMNLGIPGSPLDYVNTGTWAGKAAKEARKFSKDVHVIASSEDKDFSFIPKGFTPHEGASYLHLTSNNTIKGTQYQEFPTFGGIPLICDMSSDIMSRVVDMKPFGLAYAGVQKNLGPAGAAMVIIRNDMLERVSDTLPSMLSYKTYVKENSLYNTPPAFVIYVVQLVLKWLEDTVGGLEKMEGMNTAKAALLYGTIDASGGFYRGTAEPGSRSKMNVTFRLASEDLEAKFLAEAPKQGLVGLKGHRSVGGCRASIYNAVEHKAVEALCGFMKDFAARNG